MLRLLVPALVAGAGGNAVMRPPPLPLPFPPPAFLILPPPLPLSPDLQLDMARLALQAEGHELELLAVVEGEVEEGAEGVQAISAAPTMMSAEARALFLQGDKSSGLAAWKVRGLVV